MMPMPENLFVILLLCESFCFEKLILNIKLNEDLLIQQAYCIQFEASFQIYLIVKISHLRNEHLS